MKNYYEILEVNAKASSEVIEKAYKVLIKKYHPDLYDGEERVLAEEKVKNINEAYKILSDQFLKEQYDKELQKESEEKRYNNKNDSEKSNNIKTNKKSNIDDYEKDKEENENKNQIGTFGSIVSIVRTLFSHKPNLKKAKDIQREDMVAAGITLAIVVVVILILWFAPFSHNWIKGFLMPFSQN